MNHKEERMHKFYMSIAKQAATLSYSNRLKVGAIIVKNDNICSFGYNGTPKGFDNLCEDSEGKTLSSVVHSEINCISKSARNGISIESSTLYVTVSPCYDCAKAIIQSGISRVIYLEEYRITESIDFLKQSGIEVVKLSF